jgi:hypothetical protein
MRGMRNVYKNCIRKSEGKRLGIHGRITLKYIVKK